MESFNRIPQFPLLPFERDLCDTLGISEQEYRLFAEEVREKGSLRPAEYAHIPDIRCDPATQAVLISLAIGLVMTGISLLLVPKPQEPEETKSKRLADVRGRSRFNQSSDFSSVQQIAELGDPVPILFGRYQETFDTTPSTGGISVAPTMLWSRLLSYGAHQTFRGIFMFGHRVWDDEGGNRPQLEGILIGNNPLDSISERKFALYWSSGNSDGNNSDRLVSNDLIAGSRAEVSAGDRFTSDDPFLVPTREGAQEGFSMVVQPSNQTEFGVHSPIRNGNSIRVNWDSIPAWFEDIENEKEVKAQRRKIVGENNDGRGDGMAGPGRGYSPKMGLIRHNGFEYDYQTIVDVKVDDTVDFVISEMSYVDKDWATGFGGTAVTADDIQSTTNSMREAADDSLIEGELYQIGESLWQVHSRDGVYITEDEEDSSPSTITLKSSKSSPIKRPHKSALLEQRLLVTRQMKATSPDRKKTSKKAGSVSCGGRYSSPISAWCDRAQIRSSTSALPARSTPSSTA